MKQNAPLILASTSVYRCDLLARLRLPFTCERPSTDETPLLGENPLALAERLAREKAAAVARLHPDAWVLGSDQAAELDGVALGKPVNQIGAIAQLQAVSGRAVAFRTGVCLLGDGRRWQAVDTTTVTFRRLSQAEIERYLAAEAPYDCAGSFKVEGLGIGLFDAVQSQDPTALIGLPLIATARLLRQAGFAVP